MWTAEEIERLLRALEQIARQQKAANLIALEDYRGAMATMRTST